MGFCNESNESYLPLGTFVITQTFLDVLIIVDFTIIFSCKKPLHTSLMDAVEILLTISSSLEILLSSWIYNELELGPPKEPPLPSPALETSASARTWSIALRTSVSNGRVAVAVEPLPDSDVVSASASAGSAIGSSRRAAEGSDAVAARRTSALRVERRIIALSSTSSSPPALDLPGVERRGLMFGGRARSPTTATMQNSMASQGDNQIGESTGRLIDMPGCGDR